MQKVLLGLLLIVVMLIVVWLCFFREAQVNPVTGKRQYIVLTVQEEIRIGLQCAPQLAAKFGGLYKEKPVQTRVKNIGAKLVGTPGADKSGYQFDFHVLADSQIVNAFALPGGQIFITQGFLEKLKTEDEIASILSHEIAHVLGRHATERLTGENLINALSGSKQGKSLQTETENYVSKFLKLNYKESDEIECDNLAVKYLLEVGYNPDALLRLISVLIDSLKENHTFGFAQTHTVTESREELIKSAIQK
ncbi:M48 family metallopeptidase [Dyadobacter psychrotolerans]|uniref:M48 family peptidase n=1 Tax=Dyadobacter psychrotolerans TaxID=2541721 RepID=A0A4V2Z4W5_9BACT|nr:M48 family metallopeptidase [Dyadobacter psychrotolerans]TDE18338.1 M48 family peptidase [Dyadobacter psychrotolerans]